jgi:hypothetical protein
LGKKSNGKALDIKAFSAATARQCRIDGADDRQLAGKVVNQPPPKTRTSTRILLSRLANMSVGKRTPDRAGGTIVG